MVRVVAGLLGFLGLLISFAINAASTECQQHQCVAVVDAGSTGSRLHIYAYDTDLSNTPINIKELWSKKIKPGIATIESNQATVDAYLTILFSGAPEGNLPVYFYATAGMRLLPAPKQKHFYNLVQNWFANQSQWQLKSSKTITGSEEGLYGWLAVNYKLGTLNTEGKNTVGTMDMGGASVQIAFPVERTDGIKATDIQQIDLYGRHLQLFVHSFLGLGQTEVTHQYLDATSCFANEYELPNGSAAEGEAATCKAEVASLLNGVHRVNQIVQPAIDANPISNWFVIGGMAELVQSPPFQFPTNQFTNESLLEQANTQVCHQPWSSLSSLYPGNEYLYGYCLFPAYYYALMVDGYGVPPQQPINYLTANQVGDWTLGVVFSQVDKA
ncbi:multidrug DMT transporter permease [Legionella micdadei]|uniref:Ectonucleoside triphosphate diphosphohydrolase I n=1 Tax=Legionella micdadei TaxID=451 RepID=A0A098GH32_LEGMI|nr:multidrug DMT transporter permease [Legionella micdadei]KTD29140.1 ectonucleoside triphosphate diphosphohydrolase [Legionella micdadei]NSL17484.1 multidrug DMT transporter permease [Legionella micdadei]CEG61292.1 Ectonucleoside triphosphate diphosphohydrolase I [Legionella micdadei]SCY36847.1 Golgi nucleoside diphosphatase [Legionella micdadei]